MVNSGKSSLGIVILILFILVLTSILFINIAYSNAFFDMFAWTIALLFSLLISVFLLFKPLETLIVYFALSTTLQMLNSVRLGIPDSFASIGFGGIIQAIILIFGTLACLRKKNPNWHHSKGIQIVFIFFLLWIFISLAVNISTVDMPRALKEFGRLASLYIVFLIGLKYSNSIDHIKKFVIALFFSLIVPLGMAVMQIFTLKADVEGYRRVMGSFGIPNMFGMYIILPMLMLIILSLSFNLDFEFKIVTLPFFFFLLLLLFFTYTRASWLAFIIGILYIGVIKYKRLIPYAIIGVLILFMLFSIESLRLGKSGSSGRIGLWTNLLPASLSSPVFGHGLTEIGEISLKRIGSRNGGQNEYLLFLLESGFVGSLAFIVLIILFFRAYHSALKLLKEDIYKDFAFGFLVYFLCMCVIAIFESNAVFQNWVWLPGGIFLGFCLQSSMPDANEIEAKP